MLTAGNNSRPHSQGHPCHGQQCERRGLGHGTKRIGLLGIPGDDSCWGTAQRKRPQAPPRPCDHTDRSAGVRLCDGPLIASYFMLLSVAASARRPNQSTRIPPAAACWVPAPLSRLGRHRWESNWPKSR